jgi:hypothetical protein
MYGKQQWRGREVEGRYSDIMTWFVRELGDGINVDDLQVFPHYYFTIEYVESMLATKSLSCIEAIREILDTTNSAVTLEANKDTLKNIPPDLFNRCHIIYRVQDDAVQLLKDTDTFSVDAGWYRVHQVTKCNMMQITPDNYKFDEEL